jgi:2-iminobutanoate/2-iminopropanoate deaminase
MKQVIFTPRGPRPVGQYSQAIRAGNTLYCAGQIPIDPETGEVVRGGIIPQTKRALENLCAVLEAAALTAADVVRTTVFLADLDDYAAMNQVYARYFSSAPPARTTIQAGGLPRGARIEIAAIAVLQFNERMKEAL